MNKSILSILRKLTKDEPKKWSTLVPYAVMAINSSVSETTKYTPYYLVHGIQTRDILDMQLPYIADNIAVNEQQAYAYWFENLKKVRKFAAENIRNAKEIQKQNYDKHARSHSFNVGDYVYIKVEKWNENDDTKLKNFYKGRYKIVKFLSDTNVILSDEKGKQLPRSVYINKLKKCKIRKEIPIPESNKEKNSDLNGTRVSIERDMDYESDSSDSNTIIYDNQSQQSDISDNKLDRSSNDEIIEDSDTTLIQNPIDNAPNDEYFQSDNDKYPMERVHKIYRKRILADGKVQYYVSYKNYPAKKDRVWINEKDMNPELQKYASNRKLQITKANINMLECVSIKTH